MKRLPVLQPKRLLCFLCLLFPFAGVAAQFVGLTVELQMCDWNYMFFTDRLGKYPGEEGIPSIFRENSFRRCVVGNDRWMIESSMPGFVETRWFTGSNIIAHTEIREQPPAIAVSNISQRTGLAVTAPPAGHRYTRIHESLDGNPGRPGGVADLMGFDLPASISWLAFCSGIALKREGRRIFPPSAMWKESDIAFSGWSEATEVFHDGLGLPRTMNLISTNGQLIFQYQVRQSTNVLGWEIPLEFYGVQYLPSASNTWKLHLTFKGRVTWIGPTTPPVIPPEVMKVVEK